MPVPKPNYSLSDFGSYTVGGRSIDVAGEPKREIQFTPTASHLYDPNGSFLVEHLYVQYFVPAEANGSAPVILQHGGGLCGTCWETTPDRRPGWLHLLLQRGYEVHVVDGVERGRAGWCSLDGVWPDAAIQRSLQEAWSLFRFGDAKNFSTRKAYSGQRFPVAHLEEFARLFVPRWTSTTTPATTAFEQLLRKFDSSIVICHSQGGQIAINAIAEVPERVYAICALEPSGFATNVAALAGVPTMLMYGDFFDIGEQTPALMQRGHDWASSLRDAGGTVDIIALPDRGIRGNSHMFMMDDNNAAVLDELIDWLARCDQTATATRRPLE